jgi:proteasome accessory factor A
VPLAGGGLTTALEVQSAHLQHARRHFAGRDSQTDWVLSEWEEVLAALGEDPERLVGRCDWATKKWLLDAFAVSEGLDWGNPDHRVWLQSQDLEYHNLEPEEGLFRLLEARDQALRLTRDDEVARALVEPPADTRAYFRGRCLERFGEAVRSVNWDHLEFGVDGRTRRVDLQGWVDGATAASYNQILDQARNLEELLARLPGDG